MVPRYELVQASMRCLEQFQLGKRYASASFEMKKRRSIDSPRVTLISSKTLFMTQATIPGFRNFSELREQKRQIIV